MGCFYSFVRVPSIPNLLLTLILFAIVTILWSFVLVAESASIVRRRLDHFISKILRTQLNFTLTAIFLIFLRVFQYIYWFDLNE